MPLWERLGITRRVFPYPVLLFGLSLGRGLLAPVLAVYFRQQGLSLLEVGIVASVFEVSMLAFELPTGFIADRFGRKVSVACCFACLGLAGVVFWLAGGVTGFITATVLQGLGYTCVSGALQAWAVDTLKQQGEPGQIQNTIISGVQGRQTGLIVGSILGGYLGLRYMTVNWLAYIILNACLFSYTIMGLREDRGDTMETPAADRGRGLAGMFAAAPGAVRIGLLFCFVCLVHEFAVAPIDEYWPVYGTEEVRLSTAALGWLLAGANLFLIVAVRPAIRWLTARCRGTGSFIGVNLAGALLVLLIVAANRPLVAAAAFVGFRFAVGLYEPIFENHINALIDSRYRATVLSIYNMAGSAGEIAGIVAIGAAAESAGLRTAFLLSAAGIAVTLILFGGIGRMTARQTQLSPNRHATISGQE